MVLFDCDGVIVDSEPLTNDVIIQNLAGYGLSLTQDDVANYFIGGTMQGVMDTSRSMGARLPDDWLDEIYGLMLTRLAQDVALIPGVTRVLDALDAAGIPFAIGSNGPHRKMDVTLTKTGIGMRFAGRIYSREDVVNAKPAPDVYLKAAKDAGIAPQNCVVVEDSASGAKAGKAAGMVTFGFAADTDPAKLEPICDHVFKDMRDLPQLLGL
ncbi:MAG: HAD family hydrolase [Paracoccaceae bacterium]